MKKGNIMSLIATTTHTMVVKLFHKVVVLLMRWLFREATTCFSLIDLSHPHHQKSYMAMHETTYAKNQSRNRSPRATGAVSDREQSVRTFLCGRTLPVIFFYFFLFLFLRSIIFFLLS
jgi:ABC-type protease/lipase transport system fused ATPase/permease subunit